MRSVGLKILSIFLMAVLVVNLPFPFQNSANASTNYNLFVSAENSQFNNYFAGPQVIQVVVSDPDIQRLDQAYGEPVVTVNGKKLRMAQATDGNWYAYFADRNIAEAADSTSGAKGKGLDFGGFCSSGTGQFAVGVDFPETKGFTIARTNGATGVINGTQVGTSIPPTACTATLTGGALSNHVVRENKTLNTFAPGGKVGQIASASSAASFEAAWPVIQLFDFSGFPTSVYIDYQKAGGDQIVILTYDLIPSNLISSSIDRTTYPTNSQVFVRINDPQLNIDPTEEDSWTWGANATKNTLYYQAFNRNGAPDADGQNDAMQNLIGNLTKFMFNHNGRFTFNPAADGVRLVDFQSNGKQVISPSRGDPATAHTSSIRKNSEPITFIETGGVNTGEFANWDAGKKSNIVTRNDQSIRGHSADLTYNNISTSIVGGFAFGALNMNGPNGTWASGQRIPVVLIDSDANKNSKLTERLSVYEPTTRIPTMVIGSPFGLSSGGVGNEVPQYFAALPAIEKDSNGTFTLGSFGTLANATNLAQDEQISKRPVFNATGWTAFSIANTGGLLVDLKTSMQSLRNTIHDPRPGNSEHFSGFNFLNFDLRSFGYWESSYPSGVQVFLAYNTGGPILNSNNSPSISNHYFNLANSTSLQDFINLNQTQPGKVDATTVNALLFSDKIPSSASIGLLFSFTTSGDTLNTNGQPIVADFFSTGLLGDGLTSDKRINNGIYRFELGETGDNTGVFFGAAQFVMLNQLNIFDPGSYSPLWGIGFSPVKFPAIQEMLQSAGLGPTIKYLDLGADGIDTQISAEQDISTHTGVISFDSKTYKIGDTATITLEDADLNSNNDLVDIFTTVANGTDPASDSVGKDGLGKYSGGKAFGRLMDIRWLTNRWANTCFGASDKTDGGFSGDLFGTGFTLVETGASTGIFTGVFEIPDQFCNETSKQSTAGREITAKYVDFRDASGNLVEVKGTSWVLKPAAPPVVELDKTLYTWTDKVKIKVIAPSQNQDPNKIETIGNNTMGTITISTRGHSISPYSLVETGPDTGVFTGFVTLTGNANIKNADGVDGSGKQPTGADSSGMGPRDGLLPSEDSDGISVTFQTQDQQVTKGALIRWNVGQVSWLQTNGPSSVHRILQIIDPDMNINPNAKDTFSARVFSNSDLAGIKINMTENVSNSGIFEGIVHFTNDTSFGSRLHLSGGNNTVIGQYTDRTLPAPYVPADQIAINANTTLINGNAAAGQSTISLDKSTYTWTDKVNIIVNSQALNLDPNKIETIGNNDLGKITVSTNGHSISHYKLVETGPDTGVFTGNVTLTGDPKIKDIGGVDGAGTEPTGAGPSGAGPQDGILPAENIDGISASLQTQTQTVVATAPIQWNIGSLMWLPQNNPSGNATCQVADPDVNLNPSAIDKIITNVWSDSDSGGIRLVMAETGPDSGIFQGVVFFTNSSSSGNNLHAVSQDKVTCEYRDRTLPSPYAPDDQLRLEDTMTLK